MLLFILVEEDEHEVEETLDLRKEDQDDKGGNDQDREDTEKNGNQDCVAIEMQGKLYNKHIFFHIYQFIL